jgi:ubiquinone/menaquinone biosynthesis C-methylase UbiE
MSSSEKYIPAFGHDSLTVLYDPLLKWVMQEDRFKNELIRQAQIQRGQHVLDLGCGTGTLTILTKQLHPDSEVVGLDGDPKVLEIARAKAAKAGLEISLDLGMAFDLPYPDNSYDRVLSCLMFHHLSIENKHQTLKEVHRVLRSGGEIHIADFGKPHNPVAFLISLVIRSLERTSDQIKGLLPEMLRQENFAMIEVGAQFMTVFGTLSLYKGQKL